jgi:hypothetical protein
MMTRRELMRSAVAATAAGAVGGLAAGCDRQRPARTDEPAGGDHLVVETAGGLAVLAARGRTVVAAGPGLLAPQAARLVRTVAAPGQTEVVGHDLRGGAARWRAALNGRLEARAVSTSGRLVALATPGAAGGSPYRPGGRTRTTLVVADDGGERVRMDLPGNLEPEAFSADSQRLFVLDYLPPEAPDRYRVRMVNLTTRKLGPLATRAKSVVPPGAEEEMRGQGRQAVYDPKRQLLFTLYTHQPEHLHTRDLLAGARDGAAHVHAFVHTLSLREHWAYCIDLPAPFGERPAARHAISLGLPVRHDRLVVVEAVSGTMAVLDPDALTVNATVRFKPPAEGAGEAAAGFTPDGSLVLATGPEVVRITPAGREVARWTCGSDVRGLVPHPDGERVYVGQRDAVVCHEIASGRELSRITVPGLTALRDLLPA